MGTLIALDDDLIWVNNGGSSPTPPEPDIPDGTTAIPINDVVIWQKCAGLTQQYQTLSEVLEDSGIVRTLMNSKNAVDYLVRSTGFAKSQALVPTMTSDTTPSGECFGDSISGNNSYYLAFDGNNSTYWCSNTVTDGEGQYVGYDFITPVNISKAYIYIYPTWSNTTESFKLQYSDNGTNYTDCSNLITIKQGSSITFDSLENEKHRYWRIYKYSSASSTSSEKSTRFPIYTLQFYSPEGITESSTAMTYIGTNDYASDTLLADPTWSAAINASAYWQSVMNGKAPIMTSNTTPSGQCICDGTGVQTGAAWTLFDGSTSTALYEYGIHTKYFGYIFTDNVLIRKFYIYQHYPYAITSARLDGYTGSAWETITTLSLDTTTSTLSVETNKEYQGFRIVQLAGVHAQATYLYELQFYGRRNGGVQSWLTAGGVTDKNYTTVSQVLNDPVTLQALMQSENAVNYLVACKMWIDEICSNENAMTYIGYSNYASNTLLADSEWRKKICASTYYALVLNITSPNMTSNTTPSGICSASAYADSYPPYRAFSNTGAVWYYGGSGNTAWIQYAFEEDVNIIMFDINNYYGNNIQNLVKTKLDDSSSQTVSLGLTSNTYYQKQVLPVDVNTYGKYRFNLSSSGANRGASYIKFYGRKDL